MFNSNNDIPTIIIKNAIPSHFFFYTVHETQRAITKRYNKVTTYNYLKKIGMYAIVGGVTGSTLTSLITFLDLSYSVSIKNFLQFLFLTGIISIIYGVSVLSSNYNNKHIEYNRINKQKKGEINELNFLQFIKQYPYAIKHPGLRFKIPYIDNIDLVKISQAIFQPAARLLNVTDNVGNDIKILVDFSCIIKVLDDSNSIVNALNSTKSNFEIEWLNILINMLDIIFSNKSLTTISSLINNKATRNDSSTFFHEKFMEKSANEQKRMGVLVLRTHVAYLENIDSQKIY